MTAMPAAPASHAWLPQPEPAIEPGSAPDLNALVEQLRCARIWGWSVFDNRSPGAARDLAWALIALTRDHDPDTYSPWLQVEALQQAQLAGAIDLAAEIARVIREADRLQPGLVRTGEARQ